mmetsp:Transcript_31081/g.27361  ORF Transcript_31081/g.27361 Transcript_31081/m.27361 type:complete len:232 (+) Transcript_31081:75-770(+)
MKLRSDLKYLCILLYIINGLISLSNAVDIDIKPKRFKSSYDIISYTRDNNRKSGIGVKPSLDDESGQDCGDWTHVCISVTGLEASGNPEINDIYCIYECDINNYIKFQSQTTCSYYIKWIPNHYIIYSYKKVRAGTVSNHLFASARDCDRDLNGYQHLSTCKFWNVFNANDERITEYNVIVEPLDNDEQTNECTTSSGITDVNMDRGEIAAIIIVILAVFIVAFGGAMRYH